MYLLSEVREVTSCPTSKSARYAVRRSGVQILSALIGSLHGRRTGWDLKYLNEFGARVSLQPRLFVECLSILILMQLLDSVCY